MSFVESDTFSIKRVYKVPAEDCELVRVEFEYTAHNYAGELDYRITEGYLICDPSQQWALTEYGGTRYTYINKYTLVQHAKLELGEIVDGIPIATKILLSTSSPDDPGTTSSNEITIEVTDHDVPEEEFYLSFYGLPEPNFEESWFGSLDWYLIGGIGCILIGVIIKWRKS